MLEVSVSTSVSSPISWTDPCCSRTGTGPVWTSGRDSGTYSFLCLELSVQFISCTLLCPLCSHIVLLCIWLVRVLAEMGSPMGPTLSSHIEKGYWKISFWALINVWHFEYMAFLIIKKNTIYHTPISLFVF